MMMENSSGARTEFLLSHRKVLFFEDGLFFEGERFGQIDDFDTTSRPTSRVIEGALAAFEIGGDGFADSSHFASGVLTSEDVGGFGAIVGIIIFVGHVQCCLFDLACEGKRVLEREDRVLIAMSHFADAGELTESSEK